jgi:hypothetical protein
MMMRLAKKLIVIPSFFQNLLQLAVSGELSTEDEVEGALVLSVRKVSAVRLR